MADLYFLLYDGVLMGNADSNLLGGPIGFRCMPGFRSEDRSGLPREARK